MLFSTAFSLATVPQSWKTPLVTPVFKRGGATDTANYTPIAVGKFKPLSRLYASILVQRLVQHTEQQGLRCPTQAGYRPEHSSIQLHVRYLCCSTSLTSTDASSLHCISALWTSNLHMTGCSGSCYRISFVGWGYKAPCWAPYSPCMMGACSPSGSTEPLGAAKSPPWGCGRGAPSAPPCLASSLTACTTTWGLPFLRLEFSFCRCG